jgi:hypothetical protein
VPGAFRYSNRSTCRAAKSSTAPLVRLRPLQGTTRQGPPVHPSARLSSGRLALRAPPKEASSCPPPATPAQPRRDRSDPPRENPRSLGFPAALVEFYAPTTLELRRVHFTPVCLTGYVPPTGFLTLSAACSSPERPALFHAGNAHGVVLSRDFPSQPGLGSSRRQIALSAFLLASASRSLLRCEAPGTARPLGPRPDHSAPSGPCSGCESVPAGRSVASETRRPIPS